MSLNPDATEGEGVRRVIVEDAPHDLIGNIRLYEEIRHNKIRDQHISYTRSVAQNYTEGKTLEYIVYTITREVPAAGMDIPLTVQLLNYFMEQAGHEVRFDHLLNAVLDTGIVAASGVEPEGLQKYVESITNEQSQLIDTLVQSAGERICSGFPLHMLMPFVRGDVVWESMDNILFVERLNAYLREHGSQVRFDQYLEVIE